MLTGNIKFVYELSEDQIEDLLELFKNEDWSKNRETCGVKKMLSSSWTLGLVDTENGKLVAFSRVLSDFTYRAFIYDVIVAKEYRGLGLGKKIVRHILNHDLFKDLERIELNCGDHNVVFYEKLGFRKVPEGTNMMRYA